MFLTETNAQKLTAAFETRGKLAARLDEIKKSRPRSTGTIGLGLTNSKGYDRTADCEIPGAVALGFIIKDLERRVATQERIIRGLGGVL